MTISDFLKLPNFTDLRLLWTIIALRFLEIIVLEGQQFSIRIV